MSQLPPVIIGTAGHVDHGKSALIRALTGVETDRLREEQERGISIDLGFAPFRLPSGRRAGVVDVPGHERFIHNMLAGVGGMDLVLLVIDVNEGIRPQTREHLQILELLAIPRGIVVLTKCDLAESAAWLDLVTAQVREELAGSFLEQAPLCRVSAVTGAGLPELVACIETSLRDLPARDASGPLRLPVDRHFSVAGFGTVITGTLLSGTVRPGETVEVLPAGRAVRVRDVQVHGEKVTLATAGQRVALNLVGLERDQIPRGSVVGTPGAFAQTQRLDARLALLPGAPRPLKFRDPVHLHLGTARVVGLVALLDRDQLAPGESALVQIHLDRPLVAHRQDRFIIRSYSPMTTIGGGLVIDPAPAKHRRFRDEIMAALAELEAGETSFLLQKIASLGCARARDLEGLAGLGSERIADHLDALVGQGRLVRLADQVALTDQARQWEAALLAAVRDFHRSQPLLPGIPHATLRGCLPRALAPKAFDQLLAGLAARDEVVVAGETVRASDFAPQAPPALKPLIDQVERAYREAGVQAKNRREMLERLGLGHEKSEPVFAFLFASGRLVRLNDEMALHAEAYAAALAALSEHFARQPSLTLAQFRDRLGSARKLVQALLEYFDARKYTLRRGDERVAWQLPRDER